MTKVAVLDEREIWAEGVAALVQRCGFELAGVWADPCAALRETSSAPPDILILAAQLAKRTQSHLDNLKPRPAIILVVEPGDALDAGVLTDFPFVGLLFRDTPVECARACLTAVADGHAWLDPSVFQAFLSSSSSHQHDFRLLSARELEVANLASQGLSNKHIARELSLSDGTVKMHMHHILAKLHMARRTELLEASFRASNGAD